MTKFIRKRELVEWIEYERAFHLVSDPGSGFSFPCDENGNIKDLQPAGAENLRKCLSGELPVVDGGMYVWHHHYYLPAVIRCDCGRDVELVFGWLNECECGRGYNGFGQLLAPRSQWGEETGETF